MAAQYDKMGRIIIPNELRHIINSMSFEAIDMTISIAISNENTIT